MFRNFETNYYLCTDEIKTKWQKNNPKVAYLEEALSFIESIPKSASDKNILTLKNKRYGTGRKIQVVQFRRSA